jgi:hypothetical protein
MATVYKKITPSEIKNKQISQASSFDKTQVSNILGTFVNLFKDKHLS